jgi:hypothetical protein
LINDDAVTSEYWATTAVGGTVLIDLMSIYTITHVILTTGGEYNEYISYHVGNTNNGLDQYSCGDGTTMSCSGPTGTSTVQQTVCPSGVTGRYFCIKKLNSVELFSANLVIYELQIFADVCSGVCDTTEYKYIDLDECKNCPAHSTAPLGSTSITACVCDAGYTSGNGAACVASPYVPPGRVCTSVNVARSCYDGMSACPVTVSSEFSQEYSKYFMNDGNVDVNMYASGLYGGTAVIDLMRTYTITHVNHITGFSGNDNIYTSYHVGNTNNGQNTKSCAAQKSMTCGGLNGVSLQQDTVCPSGVTGQYFCIQKPYVAKRNSNQVVIKEIEIFADVCVLTCNATEYNVNNDVCCPAHSTAPFESTSRAACQPCSNVCGAGESADPAGGCTCVACVAGSYKDAVGTAVCTACPVGTFKTAIGNGACINCTAGTYSTAVAATSDVCRACRANSISPEASAYCVCNKGYTEAPDGECKACVVGKYKHHLG